VRSVRTTVATTPSRKAIPLLAHFAVTWLSRIARMGAVRTWPAIEAITTARCRLEPLSVAHADAMVDVLAEPALYEFTGGTAPTLVQLRRRYRDQVVGHSDDGRQWWLNWIVTMIGSARAIGYLQATVEPGGGVLRANLAWVVDPRNQGRGFATEAAEGMINWLAGVGVRRCVAYTKPEHHASAAVARKLGMLPTDVVEDGEVGWELSR
jgi:RimJ/RimL family protein N-acetyltransferase